MKNSKLKNQVPSIKKSLTLYQYCGLEYLTITNIPILQIGDPYSEPQFRSISKINAASAAAILKNGILIRGKEVHFFRKDVLEMSMDSFSKELTLTFSTIHHWEKNQAQTLHPINELAVRALMADKLQLNLKIRLRKSFPIKPQLKINAKNLVKFRELEIPARPLNEHLHDY